MEPKVGMYVKKFNSNQSESMRDGDISKIRSIEGGQIGLASFKSYVVGEFSPTGKLRLCDERGNMLPMDGTINTIQNPEGWTLHEPVGNSRKAPFRRAPIWVSKNYLPTSGIDSNIALHERDAMVFRSKKEAEDFREAHYLRPSWMPKQIGKPVEQALLTSAPIERIPCDHEPEIAKLKDRYNLVLEQNRKFETDLGLEHQERLRLEGLLKEAWAELGRFGMLTNTMRRERDAIVVSNAAKSKK